MIQASVPFLLFHDECDEALSYYVDIFQAEILEKMTFEDVGYTEDTQRKNCIANATFKLGNNLFYASDMIEPDIIQTSSTNSRISFWLELDTFEELRALESQLLATGSINLVKLHETFWESHYTKIQDKFGIVWELNAQQ
ncbi:hypothetical protein IGI39_000531 [Enterococcus sp. AZ135]|uniref:VOC family protein n=1 Tax=unclassified Enterococcus TaxID=2608891 RepID=UPI003F286D05